MKTLKLILAIYFVMFFVPVGAQTKVTIPQPEKSAKMVYVAKSDTIIITNKDTARAQVLEVAQKDSTVKAQTETIKAKDNEIADIRSGVKARLLNGVPIDLMIAAFIIAMVAMFIRWVYTTLKKVKANKNNPTVFSWNLFLLDCAHKLMRLFANLGITYFYFIFCQKLLGAELSLFIAFFIGLFIDILADKLMNMKPETIFKTITPAPETNNTDLPK